MNEHAAKDHRYHQAIADEYDAVVVAPRAVGNALVFRRLAPAISPGERMLDLASGTGHMIRRFGSLFEEVIAVDHSDAMLRRARTNVASLRATTVRFVASDVLDYLERADDEQFDLITCTGFLHHLPPARIAWVVRRARALLRRAGVLLVAEPIATGRPCPVAIERWNRVSVLPTLRYSVEAVEPDEAPIDHALLVAALAEAGFAVERAHRSWEIFPRHVPPTLVDWIAIWALNRIHGKSGNVLAIAARKR